MFEVRWSSGIRRFSRDIDTRGHQTGKIGCCSSDATVEVALFVPEACLVGAQKYGASWATQISGDRTPGNMGFARRGFFVNWHHFQSSSKNDAD